MLGVKALGLKEIKERRCDTAWKIIEKFKKHLEEKKDEEMNMNVFTNDMPLFYNFTFDITDAPFAHECDSDSFPGCWTGHHPSYTTPNTLCCPLLGLDYMIMLSSFNGTTKTDYTLKATQRFRLSRKMTAVISFFYAI